MRHALHAPYAAASLSHPLALFRICRTLPKARLQDSPAGPVGLPARRFCTERNARASRVHAGPVRPEVCASRDHVTMSTWMRPVLRPRVQMRHPLVQAMHGERPVRVTARRSGNGNQACLPSFDAGHAGDRSGAHSRTYPEIVGPMTFTFFYQQGSLFIEATFSGSCTTFMYQLEGGRWVTVCWAKGS